MQTNTTPYQKIALASRTTGLSQYFLRKGCKEGTIPHTVSTVHSPKPQKGKIYTKWYTGKFFKMAFSLYYLYQLHERR